jgi:MoxR-like ATPase
MDKTSKKSRMPIKKRSGNGGRSPPNSQSKDDLKRKLRKSRHDDDDDDESVDSRGNIRGLIDYSDESELSDYETDTSGEEPVKRTSRPPRRNAAKKALKMIRNKYLKKTEEAVIKKKEDEEEDEEEEEEGDMEEEAEEDGEDEEEDEEDILLEGDGDDNESTKKKNSLMKGPPGISISFGPFGGEENDKLVPKRHNMKKEPEMVKKFVKLITNPPEETTIDDQIDQFKELPEAQQKNMIEGLERRPKSDAGHNGQNMMFRILTMKVKPTIQSLILGKYNALQMLDPTSSEYFKTRNWIEKATSLPIGEYKDLPVKLEDGQELCGSFMDKAKHCLDSAIYGQSPAKLQILQFIASKITNPNSRGLSLLLVGPPGIGKTSLIKNGIAKALGWPFQFISLGGDSDASTYTGHQLVYEGSHSGKIANSLISAKSMSLVLLFDELDKISNTPKGEEVQNLLIHLTDAVQNEDFEDKYLSGIPMDLSKVMFVFSANDINKLDKILLDRFVVVELEGYKKPEKISIAEKFLWPDALKEVNLAEKVALSRDILDNVIDEYCSHESGVRELRRSLIQIAQKINMLRMFNTKDLPFHIPDFKLPFVLKKEHIKLFLTKRDAKDLPPQGMYM